MLTIDYLFNNKIIWLGDDLIRSNNWDEFKSELTTLLNVIGLPEQDSIKGSLNTIQRRILQETNQCLWYVRFSGFNKKPEISYYIGDEFDLEDAREVYNERVEGGYKPLKWSNLTVGDIDIDDIFKNLNESFETSSMFDQLNESEYQPKLNLRFVPGISDADELDKVLEVLAMVYSNLKWQGGAPITTRNVIRTDDSEEGFEYDPIYYLTIGFFPQTPDKLTYTCGPDDDIDMADSEHHDYNWVDGWQWVRDNYVDYDETSSMFDQLNESDYKEPFLFRKKIWFDDDATRENIEEIYEILIGAGYKGFSDDNKDGYLGELETFIEHTGLGYFYLTKPNIDYGSITDISLDLEEIKESPNWVYYKDVLNLKTSDIFDQLNESVSIYEPKVGDFLYCHKEVIMQDNGSKETTVGKFYPIVVVLPHKLAIINDGGGEHTFSTNPEVDWYYGIWFQLFTKEDKKDYDSTDVYDILKNIF